MCVQINHLKAALFCIPSPRLCPSAEMSLCSECIGILSHSYVYFCTFTLMDVKTLIPEWIFHYLGREKNVLYKEFENVVIIFKTSILVVLDINDIRQELFFHSKLCMCVYNIYTYNIYISECSIIVCLLFCIYLLKELIVLYTCKDKCLHFSSYLSGATVLDAVFSLCVSGTGPRRSS